MKTTLKQCENLTADILQKRLEINEAECKELIDLLKGEHVLREKYTFACPECGALNTVQLGEVGDSRCQICSAAIDVRELLEGATIRFIMDRDDFYEFMEENYKVELEAAKRGEKPTHKVVRFSGINMPEEGEMSGKERKPRLFISHSTEDAKYVKAFVGFLEGIGMEGNSIFCSSVGGYTIPWGANIFDYLADEFTNPDNELIVLLMLSSNYYKSPACLNEMGASWILKKDYRTILLPGFEYKEIKGAIDAGKIAISMDSVNFSMELNDIKNQFAEIFGFQAPVDAKWDRIRQNFIDAINIAKEEGQGEE